MEATHRVKGSNNKTVGFIVEGQLYTDYFIVQNIGLIDNLSITKDEVIRAKKELPVIQYKEITTSLYKRIVQQNPFIRDIQKNLLEWKTDPLHKVLQLEGARQIGKTTELLKFGYNNYEYVIYVNLASDTYDFIGTVIEKGVNPIILEGYCRKAGLPHFVNNKNTLIIIDEIQVSVKAYNSIRPINGGLECDLIVTGSYLGRILGDRRFFLPAGTISYLQMFPLSFREFCRIYKADKLLDKISLFGESNKNDYKILDNLYCIYRQIGGYPSVIQTFTATNNIEKCISKVGELLEIFKDESKFYFKDDKEVLIFNEVFTEAIRQMASEKKGNGLKLVEDVTELVKSSQKCILTRDEVSRAIRWIIYSGIIGECGLYIDGRIQHFSPSRRIYYLDCGIANYIANEASLDKSNLEGLLTETFVYTELYRLYSVDYVNKLVRGEHICFSTYGNHELDFMIISKDRVVYGIEVKTTTGDPKSLKVYLDKKLIDRGIVAKRTIGGHGEKFDTIPIYTVGVRFPY